MHKTPFLFAFVFLGIKYLEYEHKFHLGQLPGEYYSYMGPEVVQEIHDQEKQYWQRSEESGEDRNRKEAGKVRPNGDTNDEC